MKKRMWLWCLIAAFGLSFSVACSDDDEKEDVTPTPTPTQPVPPTDGGEEPIVPTPTDTTVTVEAVMEIDKAEIEVAYTGGEITFVTTTNQTYTVASAAEWITITDEGRAETADYTVKATVAANEGEAREGKITVTYGDEAATVKEVLVKQAAYVAPEQTPVEPEPTQPAGGYVVPEGAKTYTVEVDVAGYVDIAAKHNIAELIAGCDTEATVQMAYLNENGEMAWQDWSVSDGWFGIEGAQNWGDGCIACIKPNADGSFGYIAAYSGLEAGATATAIFNYGNDVIVAITANVVEPAPVEPGDEFVAPEADYTYTSELEYNNSWYTTSWSMTAEDEVAILAALGLDGDYDYEGAIADAVTAGDIIIKGFNADGTLTENVTSDHTGNSGYWFAADGTVSTYGSGTMCAEFGSGNYYEGTMCMMANLVEEEKTYPGYYVYTAGDAQVIVKLEMYVAPKPAEPVFEVVKTYEFTRDVVYVAEYGAVAETFSIETQMTDIEGLIGGTPDTFQMSAYNDNLEPIFQSWSVTDGWFGVDGAAYWGNDARFCMKPTATGTFNSDCCMPDVSAGTTGKCTFRYGNSATMKAVDVVITVNIAAE